MQQVRVVVAEDHPLMRGLICEILDSNPCIEVVDEASNGVEALNQVRTHSPDVLVLDLQMPVLSGIEVLESMRKEQLPVKVLVLSSYSDPNFIQSVKQFGIADYVTKDKPQDELVEAVISIASNETGLVGTQV